MRKGKIVLDKSKINQTLTAIIREAGLYHRQLLELNDVDSKIISLGDYILADIDGDGEVTARDVRVVVDGVPAEVVEVDAKNVLVTLEDAVSSGQHVVVRFASSSVELDHVKMVRSEALSEMIAKIPCASAWSDEYIPLLGHIQRLLAAGLLLIRDYGFNEDIEGTSKDGYKRIELANQKMQELVTNVCGSGGSAGFGGAGGIMAHDEGDLFPRKPRISSEERYERSEDTDFCRG